MEFVVVALKLEQRDSRVQHRRGEARKVKQQMCLVRILADILCALLRLHKTCKTVLPHKDIMLALNCILSSKAN